MGKGGGSQTTNTVAEPWEGAQPFLRDLLGGAQGAYGAGQFDVPAWPGMRVAPQSGMTQAGQQMTYDTAMGGNPFLSGAAGAYGDMVSGQHLPGAFNEMKQNVLADVVPATSHLFSSSGMLDSSMAADTIGRSAAEAVAPLEYGAWENAQNRRMQAMGMAPQLSGARYIDPQMLAASGQGLDQHMQALLDAGMGQWYEEANRPYDELQRAASLALGFGGMGGSQTSQQDQPGGGALSTVGGLMQVMGPLLPFMFSDRRLKTDVRRIGSTAEGYPKYEFRYHWDEPGTVRIGVMADEVPESITVTSPAGYRMVNYAEVTL